MIQKKIKKNVIINGLLITGILLCHYPIAYAGWRDDIANQWSKLLAIKKEKILELVFLGGIIALGFFILSKPLPSRPSQQEQPLQPPADIPQPKAKIESNERKNLAEELSIREELRKLEVEYKRGEEIVARLSEELNKERELKQQAEAELHSIEERNKSAIAIQAGRDEAKKVIAALKSAQETTNEARLYAQQADEAAREALKRLEEIQTFEVEINIALDNLEQKASKLDAETLPDPEYEARIVRLQKEGEIIDEDMSRVMATEQVITIYTQQAQQAVQAAQEAIIRIGQYVEQATQAKNRAQTGSQTITDETARQAIVQFAETAVNMVKSEKQKADSLYSQARMRQQYAEEAVTQATELVARIRYAAQSIQSKIDSYIALERVKT